MGFFDFFRKRMSYEELVKMGDENVVKAELNRLKLKDLERMCINRCNELETEDKQKSVFINAIIDSIKKTAPTNPNPAAAPDMPKLNPEPPSPQVPPPPLPPAQNPPMRGGKKQAKRSRRKYKKHNKTIKK